MLAVLAACGSGDRVPDGSSLAPVTTTLPRSVTGAVDLRRLVVSTAPDGFDRLAAPPFGDVDLQRLLEVFSDAPELDRPILEETGFVRGYTRGWRRDEPYAFLGVYVFEFTSASGAEEARRRFAAQNEASKGAELLAVDGIAGAVGELYTADAEGAPARTYLITFVRGPRLYLVNGQWGDPDAPPDDVLAFARAQDRIAA